MNTEDSEFERIEREIARRLAEQPATTPEVVAHQNSNGVVYAAGYPWSDAEILRPLVYGDVQPAQQEPVAYLYASIAGPVILHRLGQIGVANAGCVEAQLANDMKAAKEYPLAHSCTPLYTTPQAQRPWVGLTRDEYDAICDSHSAMSDLNFLEDIEAKLKEKNT